MLKLGSRVRNIWKLTVSLLRLSTKSKCSLKDNLQNERKYLQMLQLTMN